VLRVTVYVVPVGLEAVVKVTSTALDVGATVEAPTPVGAVRLVALPVPAPTPDFDQLAEASPGTIKTAITDVVIVSRPLR